MTKNNLKSSSATLLFISLITSALLFTCTLFFAGCAESKQNDPLVSSTTSSSAAAEISAASAQKDLSSKTMLDVYKDPDCGCCYKWITHIEDHGFASTTYDTAPDPLDQLKTEKGIPANFRSCHTAISKEGFVFEGHVPAKFIAKFIAEKPQGAFGLTVPAMPVGSPGMEVGDKFMSYKVFQLNTAGEPTVYAEVNSYNEQF